MSNRPQDAAAIAAPSSGPTPGADVAAPPAARWTPPVLVAYGDVRELTMGVSSPPGESGNPGARRP